jgi:hypothetical protein
MKGERKPRAVLVAGCIVGLVSGAGLGVVWWRLAPRVTLVVQPQGSYPAQFQPHEYLSADVTFAALAAVAGIAVAIALANMRREHLVSVLVSSLFSGVIGSAAMWWVGIRLGAVDVAGLSASSTSAITIQGPLHVTMPGVLLVWPLVSAIVVTVLALGDWTVEIRMRARSQS